ncbi:hypothetical protein DFH06DRAFT_1152696 [Mycena polygramma]|nr:hypothetical protein DFH06DRAFT_1152696 [Mycena polygramma]
MSSLSCFLCFAVTILSCPSSLWPLPSPPGVLKAPGPHPDPLPCFWVTQEAVFSGYKAGLGPVKSITTTAAFCAVTAFAPLFLHDERAVRRRRVRPAYRFAHQPLSAPVCSSTRACYAAQIRRFRTVRTVDPYDREGRGLEYVVGNVSELDLESWRAQNLNDDELIARTAFKIGHTDRLPRRQSQYRKCAQGGRVIVWIGFYRVARRYFVERFIHLRLFKHGGRRVNVHCACCVGHREYVALDSVGGFATVRARMATVLVHSEEQVDFEFLPRPPLNGDLYDLLRNS